MGEAIESALAQTHEPHEVIVIDDGSTDRTAEIAASYEQVDLRRQRNQGPGPARNRGVAVAGGEFICLLDADDRARPERVRVQLERLLERPSLGFVLAHAQEFVEPGHRAPHWGIGGRELVGTDPRTAPPRPLLPTLMARREVFDRIGGYDPAFHAVGDTDWVFRAVDAGIQFEVLDQVLVEHRFHGGNLTYSSAGHVTGRARALRTSADRHRRGAVRASPRT